MKTKKVATNLPQELFEEATEATGLNQTQTIILGLRQIIAAKKRAEFLTSKGAVAIDYNVKTVRQRKKL